MSKSSNAVLIEKINNLHSKIDEISTLLKTEIKPEIERNTSFRLQAKGFFTGMIAISSFLGAALMWLLSRIFD